MVKRKLYQLLVKGVRQLSLDRMVGERLVITTVHGHELEAQIKQAYLSILEPPSAEFVTEYGNLVLLDTINGLGILFGKPIEIHSDNIEQVEQGNSIYSVRIAGVILINGYPKDLTVQEKDT